MTELAYTLPPAFIDSQVEEHIRAVMQQSFAWYLRRFDDADGLPAGTSTLVPRTFGVSSEETRFAEQDPPSLLVVCPGTVGDLQTHGAKEHLSAWLQVNVSITAGAATEAGVRRISHRLCGAAREILAHQVPGGPVDRVQILGWRTDLVTRSRQLLACGVRAGVRVDRVLDHRGVVPPPARVPSDPAAGATYEIPDSAVIAVKRSEQP